jgi:hypothetical protein
MKWYQKIWKSIKDEVTFLYVEIKKSFSHEESFFSSKKIERMLFILTALFSGNYWFWTHVEKLEYEQLIAYCTMWLAFAGYNLATTQKEKRFNKKITKTSEGE